MMSSPVAALAIDARKLPEPASLQLVTGQRGERHVGGCREQQQACRRQRQTMTRQVAHGVLRDVCLGERQYAADCDTAQRIWLVRRAD